MSSHHAIESPKSSMTMLTTKNRKSKETRTNQDKQKLVEVKLSSN